jgi:hypothetical protein
VREGAQKDQLVKGEIDGRLLIRTIRYSIERKRMQIEREKTIHRIAKRSGISKGIPSFPHCLFPSFPHSLTLAQFLFIFFRSLTILYGTLQ